MVPIHSLGTTPLIALISLFAVVSPPSSSVPTHQTPFTCDTQAQKCAIITNALGLCAPKNSMNRGGTNNANV